MLDQSLIGHKFASHSAVVEAGRLRLFAKSTGETRPEYIDEAAARAAGHPSLPAPPTFSACLYLDHSDIFGWLGTLGVDVGQILHGAQSFRYLAQVYAGDCLTFTSRIEDVMSKRGGALIFIVRETDVANQAGVRVAEVRSTIVVRGNK